MFSLHLIARNMLDRDGPNFWRRPAMPSKRGKDERMEFRRANEGDLERLVEIHLAAYPDEENGAARQANFTRPAFGSFSHLVVAARGKEVVGHAFLFPFRAWFGGLPVRLGGIASVGIAPEARGQGVATELMRHLHRVSDRRGDALTMLYAFRQGFYARLGYTPTSSRKRLAIDTRAIPASWRTLARGRVRAARGPDLAAMRLLHLRMAERSSGWIARPKAFWDRLLARERRITMVCEPSGTRRRKAAALAGYVTFTLVQEEPHAATVIEVAELVSEDSETRRILLGALSAMRDQCAEIVLELAEGDPLERALLDSDGRRFGTETVEHSLGEIVGGPMLRIGDVPRALEARGYVEDGAFELVVRDVDAPPASVSVRVRHGRARVLTGRARSRAVLSATPAGLAAMLYGGLTVADAVALGLAEANPETVARTDRLLRLPPMTPVDAF